MQQFLDAHGDVVGTVNSSDARRQLDAALVRLEATVSVQGARVREVRGEIRRQHTLEQDLRQRHMMPVTKVARGGLASVPNIAALTPSASKLRGAPLAKAAQAMAAAAEPFASTFATASLPVDFVQRLAAAADAVQASIDARGRKRADRQQASAAVESAIREGRAAGLMIEGAVDHLVSRGSPLYSEWLGIKRIQQANRRPQPGTPAAADQPPVSTAA
jgi:hypothetical protein